VAIKHKESILPVCDNKKKNKKSRKSLEKLHHEGPCVPVFQVLAAPGVLERFIKDQTVIAEMRSMFVGLYQLTPVCGHMATLLLFDLSTPCSPVLVFMIYSSLA